VMSEVALGPQSEGHTVYWPSPPSSPTSTASRSQQSTTPTTPQSEPHATTTRLLEPSTRPPSTPFLREKHQRALTERQCHTPLASPAARKLSSVCVSTECVSRPFSGPISPSSTSILHNHARVCDIEVHTSIQTSIHKSQHSYPHSHTQQVDASQVASHSDDLAQGGLVSRTSKPHVTGTRATSYSTRSLAVYSTPLLAGSKDVGACGKDGSRHQSRNESPYVLASSVYDSNSVYDSRSLHESSTPGLGESHAAECQGGNAIKESNASGVGNTSWSSCSLSSTHKRLMAAVKGTLSRVRSLCSCVHVCVRARARAHAVCLCVCAPVRLCPVYLCACVPCVPCVPCVLCVSVCLCSCVLVCLHVCEPVCVCVCACMHV